jgi:hypothetical protein
MGRVLAWAATSELWLTKPSSVTITCAMIREMAPLPAKAESVGMREAVWEGPIVHWQRGADTHRSRASQVL